VHGAVSKRFRPRRHVLTVFAYRQIRTQRYTVWRGRNAGRSAPLRPCWANKHAPPGTPPTPRMA